jgi:murein DD-endopeptidase MepM/ murein hydrolase activator NlpD
MMMSLRLALPMLFAAGAAYGGWQAAGADSASAMAAVTTAAASSTAAAVKTTDRPSPFRQATAIGLSRDAVQGGVMLGDAPAGTVALSLDGAPVPVAPDGKFLIAFNRDAPPTAKLIATLNDGRTIAQTLAVAPRGWRIEHVDLPRRATTTSAAFQARRGPELAQINAARALRSDAEGWRQDFIWPVKGRISGLFGSQRIYAGDPGSYHSGVDVAAPTGTPFVAPADGVVTLAAQDPFTLEGKLLMIDHGMGLSSAFLHCNSLSVAAGQRVRRGEPIGTVGMTGSATGPHLHWGMKWNAARIDPLLLAGPMGL